MVLMSPTAMGQSIDELRRSGAYGFPVDSAITHCDDDQLRVQSWSSDQHLVVQAILWADGNDELGETSDGRPVGDTASLVLDVNLDKRSTPEVDRTYSLNPWPTAPGLQYTIPYKGGAQSHILGDSTGRGSIRYLLVSDNRKVRVDTFVIPLAELNLKVDQKIGVGYLGKSTVPAMTINSVGYSTDRERYYAFNLPFKTFKEVTLTGGSEKFDPVAVPEGRDDEAKVVKPKKKPTVKVGSVPPEFAAGDWLNTDSPPTLKGLHGKVVLVDFWATWCGPCVAGIPHLNQLAELHADDGLRIVSFTNQSRKGIANFQQGTKIKYPIGCSSELAAEYGVSGLPHTFLIGRDGTLVWEGNPTDDGFDKRIIDALAAEEPPRPQPVERINSPEPAVLTDNRDASSRVPGTTFFVDFPELGNTWRDKPARAGIYLPTDYSPDRQFPLLVWFGGGAGSSSPGRAISITEGKGFICVGLPYGNGGKEDQGDAIDEETGESEVSIQEKPESRQGGWQSPWSWYQTMLEKVESIVPNIDADRRIAGGTSSGGAATLYQIGNSDGAFQDYFYGFVPMSAGWPMGGLESIAGRPVLAVMGAQDKRLPNFEILEKEAIAAGVDFQLIKIPDAGHRTPVSVFPEIRDWMMKQVVEREVVPSKADAVDLKSTSMRDEAPAVETSSVTDPIDIKILFVGAMGDRSHDYVSFLQRHFASVTQVEASDLTADQMDACDVMVIDQTVTTLPFGNTKACVMIGSAAANTAQHYGSKIDWLCLCLANEAYFVDAEHPIFHQHFEVTPTLAHKKCKYTTMMIDAWKVEEPQDDPGLVSSRRYFENAADSEIVSGGVNMKGVSGVPLVREANRFLWGFAAPPSEMTEEARQVFVNAVVWMRKFDGVQQTEYRGLHPRTTYQSVLSSPYVNKHNLGKWFSADLLKEHDFDKEVIRELFTENLPYVTILVGHGQLEIDTDAQQLKTPNNDVASLGKWIQRLDSGDEAETALRLLQRYTGQELKTAEQWKKWFSRNRAELNFDETKGYRFRVSTNGGSASIEQTLVADDGVGQPSSVAPAIFDIKLSGQPEINGATYARAGSKVTLSVRANILSPWHIYAPDYQNGVNKPTQIDVQLPDGMQFVGEWQVPLATSGLLGDGAIFTRKIKLSKTFSGNTAIIGVVNFQTCTDQQCLRPQQLKFELPISVYAFEHE